MFSRRSIARLLTIGRALLLLVVLVLVLGLFASCSTAPKPTRDRYIAPTFAPLRAKIVTAQEEAGRAQRAIARAESLAPADAPDLHLALTDARKAVDALTAELLGSDILINDLEAQVKTLTVDANRERVDKNVALERADKSDAERKSAVGQRNKLFFALLAAAAWIFRKPLGSGCLFIARKFSGIPW